MADEESKKPSADFQKHLLTQRLAASTETAARVKATPKGKRATTPKGAPLPRGAPPPGAFSTRLGPGAVLPPPDAPKSSEAAGASTDATDAAGASTDAIDAAGASTDAAGASIDAAGASIDTAGASIDAAGASTDATTPEGAKRVAWDPRKVRKFMAGIINLGELEGIDREQQYGMATVAHQLLHQGKLTEAEQIFRGLIALNPSDAYFHLALGVVHQRKEELTEAEAAYSRALGLHPKNSPALANRGEVRILSGRLVEGAQDLSDAIAADPQARLPTTKRARATLSILRAQVQSGESS